MGANPTQAVGVTAFLLAFTALAGAIYAGSFLLYLVAVAFLAGSIAIFRRIKPLEQAEN
jgi:hypothetical protein